MLDDLTTLPVPPTDDPLADEPLDEEATPSADPLESLEAAAEAEAVDPDADAADVV